MKSVGDGLSGVSPMIRRADSALGQLNSRLIASAAVLNSPPGYMAACYQTSISDLNKSKYLHQQKVKVALRSSLFVIQLIPLVLSLQT